MPGSYLIILSRSFLGYSFAVPALVLPYSVRVSYMAIVASLAHLPFELFGMIARFFVSRLRIRIVSDGLDKQVHSQYSTEMNAAENSSVVILYSGGTDSTCVAALAAERFSSVHLLTFWERATKNSPFPDTNISLLKSHYPSVTFQSRYISIDALVRLFSYEQYMRTIQRHGLLALATPGYSSLSWHVRTIIYCIEHDIRYVMDGLTRELMHFPGHMDLVVDQIRELYAVFGITYSNPVREWDTPPDQQLLDRVVVGHDGIDALVDDSDRVRKTTGKYLYEKGIFPSVNLKGSRRDQSMQHDCYPFVLYNMIAFWVYMAFEPYQVFTERIVALMEDKISVAKELIDEYKKDPIESRLATRI